MTILGLVGGMAAGKSTVAGFFGDKGALVVDCDKLAKDLVETGSEHWAKVAASFGPGYLSDNGNIDRRRLGQRVFADPTALRALNSLLHPAVYDKVKEYLTHLNSSDRLVVIEAAGLVEGGLYRLCDHVCLIKASYEVQVSRIMKRNGFEREEAETRLSGQVDTRIINRFCDIVINTSGALADISRQIDEVIEMSKG